MAQEINSMDAQVQARPARECRRIKISKIQLAKTILPTQLAIPNHLCTGINMNKKPGINL
jgi:hypothetical protein